jgi:AraC-like DNA-binding protein
MKIFETFNPLNQTVARFIQYYYLEIIEENESREFSCFPHFNNSISIYNSHRRVSSGVIEYIENGKPIQIFTPIREKIFNVNQIGKFHRIVIIFNPLGIQQFYKDLSFSEFIFDYNFFSENEIELIFKDIDILKLTNLLDDILLSKYCKFENEIVENSLLYIYENFKDFSVEELSKKSQISRRHLNRLFNLHFGISVKKFQEIFLFRKILEIKLFENPNQNFTSLAYELYFSDQSHFNKIFSKMTHNSPKHFFDKGTLLGNKDTFWHLKK